VKFSGGSAIRLVDSASKCPDEAMPHRNIETHWRSEPLEKYSSSGVVRSVDPWTTIRRARAVVEQAGITRVAEVTYLDRLGIPNFMSVRPRDLDPGISYYNGKGTTRGDAYAGALMEAIERHAGEYCSYTVVRGSHRELKRRHACVDPSDVIVPRFSDYSDDMELEWVSGFDLIAGRETLVPLNFVVCPYRPTNAPSPFMASTNGLASGNNLIEALCHALCEVIERDAQSITLARTSIGPAVRTLLDKSNPVSAGPRSQRQIALRGLPRRASMLVEKMKRAGLDIYLRDLTDTAGIAAIECTIVDDAWEGFPNAHGGCGAHPDARVALLRSLTEAAQSRVTCIQGGREDLPQILNHSRPTKPDELKEMLGGGEVISFKDIPTFESRYVNDDLQYMLDRLPSSGLTQVIAFDLTHEAVGIPVVRIVVPKAETWAVFNIHTGRGVFGSRVREVL
jgi:YcaO-like protein with predicted kinase domain